MTGMIKKWRLLFEMEHTIEQIAYRKYQLHWMMTHGYSLDCLNDVANDWWNEKFADPLYEQSFIDFLDEHGFYGALYACFSEFLQAEYRNKNYMKDILTAAEYDNYLHSVWIEEKIPYFEALELLSQAAEHGLVAIQDGFVTVRRAAGWSIEAEDIVAKDLMWDKTGREIIKEKLNRR